MAAPDPQVLPRPRPSQRDPWTALRVALVLVWLVVALATLVAGQRQGTLAELRAAVDSGRVDEVRVSEGPPPGSTGHVLQTVVWRPGLVTHPAEVWVASPGVAVPEDSRPVLPGDLAAELRAVDPGLRVLPLVEPSSWSEVSDWRVPAWAGLVLLVGELAVLFLLVSGPPPVRATRWAWFWLAWLPVGMLAFLVLSGPFPGLPAPRPGGRRLTGGWAFLVSCLLGVGFFSQL